MTWTDWRTFALVLVAIGFAVADLWYFHSIDKTTDLAILLAALGGGGVSVAHTAGVNAALQTPLAATIPIAPPRPIAPI